MMRVIMVVLRLEIRNFPKRKKVLSGVFDYILHANNELNLNLLLNILRSSRRPKIKAVGFFRGGVSLRYISMGGRVQSG